ncbi:MAG TPA: hypothetical protein VGI57_06240 [Usitatibacter sp.]
MPSFARSAVAVLALSTACGPLAFAGDAEIEAQRRNAALAVDASGIDRIVIATAQSRLPSDPKFQEKIDYFLFELRPPALWDAKSPAWAPARAALITVVRPETVRQVQDYWKDLKPLLAREVESTFQPGEAEAFLEFANTAGGKAYFERRLAELRAKNGEALYDLEPATPGDLAKGALAAKKKYDALPAAEKKQVDAFLAGAKCTKCYRPPATVMESYISGESTWLTEVFALKIQSTDSRITGTWVAAMNAKLGAALPVDSKKQLLGTLEMRKDASLAFTVKYYYNDKPDGGALLLEFPRGHPNYGEVLAFAPGLASGQSRVLYRDKSGIVNDKP